MWSKRKSSIAVSFWERPKKVTSVRNKHLIRINSTLASWISNWNKKNVGLNDNVICKKGWRLLPAVRQRRQCRGIGRAATKTIDDSGTRILLKNSIGLFDHFQKPFKIKCFPNMEGWNQPTKKPPRGTRKPSGKLSRKGDKPEQVYNMNKTGLFGKKMPSRTYIMRDEARISKQCDAKYVWQCCWFHEEMDSYLQVRETQGLEKWE